MDHPKYKKIRAGWSMGEIQDIYLCFKVSRNQYISFVLEEYFDSYHPLLLSLFMASEKLVDIR